MGITASFLHLVSFFLPAIVVAALLAPAMVWGGPKRKVRTGRLAAAFRAWLGLSALGSAVLAGGLVAFGHDGRIATYGVLVLVLGTAVAAWRARR